MITTTPSTVTVALPYTERALTVATWDVTVPITLLYGADAIVQRIRVRLAFWLGEWFLDTLQGFPYIERVFVKNPKLPVINSLFRSAIAGVPGILSVQQCAVTGFNKVTRSATISFLAKLSDGSVITAVNEPFILAVS